MENVKLPKGWVEVKLNEVVNSQKGKKPNVLQPFEFENSTPYIDIKALEKEIINQFADIKSSQLLTENDIAVVWDGSRSGWVSRGVNGALGSTLAKLTPILVERDYIFYFIQNNFQNINTNVKGIGIPHVNPDIFWNLPFVLPPLAEQTRIVAEIETVLSWVSEAQEELDKIPALLRAFRQKVLAMAVAGELTSDFRENTEGGETAWKIDKIKNISDHTLGKMLDKAKNIGELTPYLGNINVRWFEFNIEDLSDIKATQKDKHKFKIQNGDILICEGGEPGRCAIWDLGETDIIFQKALHRVRLKNYVLPKWLTYNLFLDTQNGNLSKVFTGTTIQHFTSRVLAEYEIPVPLFAEQAEIVTRVEALFDWLDIVEAAYTEGVSQLKILPQSLLHKAFSGQLVAQDPTDEPANVLLERIKLARTQAEAERKTEKQKDRQFKKTQPKMKETDLKKTIEQVLANNTDEKLTAKQVWQQSEWQDDIEQFYAELKILMEEKRVVSEERLNNISYLTLTAHASA